MAFTATSALTTCFFGALIVLGQAAYPTTYPFENEAFVPTGIPAGTPNFAFDDTDTGGYMYHFRFSQSFSLTDDMMPYCPTHGGNFMYGLVVQFGAPPVLPESVWNCSASGFLFSAADFTGKVASQTVCNVNECCSDLYGKVKFSEDQLDLHGLLSDKAVATLCEDIPERLYCLFVGGDFQTNCFEYYLSATDRLVTLTCFDSAVTYLLSCPVNQSTYSTKYTTEPPLYADQLSILDLINLDSLVVINSDKICHPASYYDPSAAITSEQTGQSDVSAESKTTSTESSSSVVALALTTYLFFL